MRLRQLAQAREQPMNGPTLVPSPPEPSRRRRDAAASLPIVFGLPEIEAAAAVGVSQTKFREMVADKTMPEPRIVGGKLVYDVDELRAAFKSLPHRGNETEDDTWADVKPKAASGG
jgi:hypothetical protein